MKKIILCTPNYLFAIIVLVASYFNVRYSGTPKSVYANGCVLIIGLSVWAWSVSLIDIVSEKVKSKYSMWLYLITALQVVVYFLNNLDFFEFGIPFIYITFSFTLFILQVVNSILLTIIIRKIFYERSLFFIFLETFIPLIGMITLTTELKKIPELD